MPVTPEPETKVLAVAAPLPKARLGSRVTTSKPKAVRRSDKVFFFLVKAVAYCLPLLLLAMTVFLWLNSRLSIHKFGWKFVASSLWDPVAGEFGALPVIYGTVVSSLIALLFAAPVSVGVALLLNEVLPSSISKVLGFLVEMLAAIPSVVYGLWGIFVLAPWMRTTVEPLLAKYYGFLPFFQGAPYGVGMLSAGIILSIMITPTIAAISREVFKAIPRTQREAALALGATRWETMRISVLDSAKAGVFGAIILGLGRALGETMAVTMVIGNRASISASLFAPSQTMASVLANEYAEATSDLHLSALVEIGLVLFAVTFLINGAARIIVWRATKHLSGGVVS